MFVTIPSFKLKDCAHVLAVRLYKILKLMFSKCEIPGTWKKACIIPAFKKGDECDVRSTICLTLQSLRVCSTKILIFKN